MARLDLPLGDVLDQKIIQHMASNGASSPVFLGGGKIRVSYDPEDKIVRARFGGRHGPVNVELDDSGRGVKSIGGNPAPTKADLQYLANSGFLCAELPDRIEDAPRPEATKSVLSDSSFSRPAARAIARIGSVPEARAIAAKPQFVSAADIIHPGELSKLVRNKDYVLLTHQPRKGVLSEIRKNGLRSLRDLAEDENASADVKHRFELLKNIRTFSNDPELIYFRPVGKGYAALKNDVVIAVKPEAVNVFNQQHRVHRSASSYAASKIPIADYLALESKQPQGTFLSRHKTFVPLARYQSGMDFIPEACVKADKIGPELFVKQHD